MIENELHAHFATRAVNLANPRKEFFFATPVEVRDILLDKVGLTTAARKRIGTYSKGMRQRLGLAQALLGSPRLLFLDEPTTGLDPLLRQSFYGIVEELRNRGVTVLLSSHALTELETRVAPE